MNDGVNQHNDSDVQPSETTVNELAKHKPEIVSQLLSLEMSANPFLHKLDKEHISTVLEASSKHDERQYELLKQQQENELKENQSIRFYLFITFLVIAVLVVIALFQFKDNPDVLIPTLTGLGGLFSGAIGG